MGETSGSGSAIRAGAAGWRSAGARWASAPYGRRLPAQLLELAARSCIPQL